MSVMGIRDKKKKKTKEIKAITREEANKRAKKHIATILIVGLVIMAADLIVSSGKGVEVESSYGQLYLVRPEAGEDSGYVSLVAEVEGKDGSYKKNMDIILKPYSKQEKEEKDSQNNGSSLEMTEEEKLEYYLRNITDEINNDSTVKKVGLPVKLETGEMIKLNPVEIKERYEEIMTAKKEELLRHCHQYQIDYVEADINKSYDQILTSYLIKRSK